MTTYDYNFDLAIREVGDQVTVTNNLGRTAVYGEIVNLDGMYGIVMEHDGIANAATGRISVLQPNTLVSTAQVNATDTFVVGRPIYFLSGGAVAAGTLEADAGGGAVAIGTIREEFGAGGAQTGVAFIPYSQVVNYGGYNTRLTAAEGFIADLQKGPGIPFRKTVKLTSAAATTAVEIIADAAVGTGKCVYITGFYANVNGSDAWAGAGNNVIVRDRATSPVAAITLAKAQLTTNAQLMFGSTGVTLGDGIKGGTGMTATKGLTIVGDGAFTAGSDLIVTITGFIGNIPAA
jgi:hypothetical protein